VGEGVGQDLTLFDLDRRLKFGFGCIGLAFA